MNTDEDRLDPADTDVAAARIVELRRELWQARDAVIGATATAGSFRARNAELEMLVHQLRVEIARLDAALATQRGPRAQAARVVALPGRVARRLLRP